MEDSTVLPDAPGSIEIYVLRHRKKGVCLVGMTADEVRMKHTGIDIYKIPEHNYEEFRRKIDAAMELAHREGYVLQPVMITLPPLS